MEKVNDITIDGKPIEIQKDKPIPRFVFYNGTEEVILLEAGKFFWKGEEVTDAHKVYERFNDWLTQTENYEHNRGNH